MFRGLERDPSNLWSLIRFHVSLWDFDFEEHLLLSLRFFFVQLDPFPLGGFPFETFLFVCLCILSYILDESCFNYKENY